MYNWHLISMHDDLWWWYSITTDWSRIIIHRSFSITIRLLLYMTLIRIWLRRSVNANANANEIITDTAQQKRNGVSGNSKWFAFVHSSFNQIETQTERETVYVFFLHDFAVPSLCLCAGVCFTASGNLSHSCKAVRRNSTARARDGESILVRICQSW